MLARSRWWTAFGAVLVLAAAGYGVWALWFAKRQVPTQPPVAAPVGGRAT